jgi:hypothetical protein
MTVSVQAHSSGMVSHTKVAVLKAPVVLLVSLRVVAGQVAQAT